MVCGGICKACPFESEHMSYSNPSLSQQMILLLKLLANPSWRNSSKHLWYLKCLSGLIFLSVVSAQLCLQRLVVPSQCLSVLQLFMQHSKLQARSISNPLAGSSLIVQGQQLLPFLPACLQHLSVSSLCSEIYTCSYNTSCSHLLCSNIYFFFVTTKTDKKLSLCQFPAAANVIMIQMLEVLSKLFIYSLLLFGWSVVEVSVQALFVWSEGAGCFSVLA